jgi:DNA replication protein DnaC
MIKIEIVKNRLKNLRMSDSLSELDNLLRDSEKQGSSYLDFLNALLEVEESGRDVRRIQRLIKQAKFPIVKTVESFDFSRIKKLNKHQILSYCDGNFLSKKENLIFIGNPGTGKTHLSIAIGYELCHRGHKVLFTTGNALVTSMIEAKDEKSLIRFFDKARKFDLVIIDEVGYFPYEKEASELFFQFISERYERGSVIISSNLPFSKWNEIFYTKSITTAILDRIVHHSNVIEMNGESYRFSESVSNKSYIK